VGARVRSGSDGAGATRQQVRRRGRGPGAGDDGGGGCAAKVVWAAVVCCKGGRWVAVVVRMEARHECGGGARVSGGVNDPDVCGLWFQESLPHCMIITPSVLFSCLL
jgi:hypothetical protein